MAYRCKARRGAEFLNKMLLTFYMQNYNKLLSLWMKFEKVAIQ